MSRYAPEPPYVHGTQPRPAVILVNLGTPEAPTASAVRTYLKEFLGDPRVVEIPRAVWLPILHGIILNVRPSQSARKYARIWSDEGSPLLVHTKRQTQRLARRLDERLAAPVTVDYAMRYGAPSIATVLAQVVAAGCDRILVVPLYPQYAASTTATVFDEVAQYMRRTRNVPEIRMVRHFHDHPAYIRALAAQVDQYWAQHGRPEKLILSFHGLPRYTLDKGDPYHCECHKTARLLAEELKLTEGQWQLTFQSRFGRTEWLQPYTLPTLLEEAGRGTGRIDVFCPGFVSDCLETLEEIGIECKEAFLSGGGKEFHFIPCLNERDDWIEALADITLSASNGWFASDIDAERSARERETARHRALAMGAKA